LGTSLWKEDADKILEWCCHELKVTSSLFHYTAFWEREVYATPHYLIPSISFFIYAVEANLMAITLGLKGRFNMYIRVVALLMLNTGFTAILAVRSCCILYPVEHMPKGRLIS
jgi:hypothetical protein